MENTVEKTSMPRAKQMKLVRTFFDRMDRICDSSHEWDVYFAQQIADERDHRRHKPEGLPSTPILIKDAARLFAVQHILQHYGTGSVHDWACAPEAKDIFAVRLVCFQGYALFMKFESAIRAEFKAAEVKRFLENVDYAALAGSELP